MTTQSNLINLTELEELVTQSLGGSNSPAHFDYYAVAPATKFTEAQLPSLQRAVLRCWLM
jgi:hypothetical protein